MAQVGRGLQQERHQDAVALPRRRGMRGPRCWRQWTAHRSAALSPRKQVRAGWKRMCWLAASRPTTRWAG